ncbi:MAG TPA: hypothetical protein VFB03_01580 [Candidatus Saccharimonadales bacterium]|nr:hypothetical protein [Candidatus Saccharimonadales bacterium]
MESLQDILANKKFSPPDEITLIKEYVERKYKSKCRVRLQRGTLVLSVPNSALAATIQLERMSLIEACHLKTKKLFIRNQ